MEVGPPRTPHKAQLSREDRIEVHALRDAGWKYQRTADHLNFSLRQVHYAATHRRTPKKRSSRPPLLGPEKRLELVEIVCASAENRRLPLWRIPLVLKWDITEYAIRRALKTEGFRRCLARCKPPISEKNRQLRLKWAQDHLNWTKAQWDIILWTDETWVTCGRHTRTWVTRRVGEELDPTCIVERI